MRLDGIVGGGVAKVQVCLHKDRSAESSLIATTLWQCMILIQDWVVHRKYFHICPRLLIERVQEMNMSFTHEFQGTGRFYSRKRYDPWGGCMEIKVDGLEKYGSSTFLRILFIPERLYENPSGR